MGALIAATIRGSIARWALTAMTVAPVILGTAKQRIEGSAADNRTINVSRQDVRPQPTRERGDIPTPLALVGNQSGFIEQRRDAYGLNQVRFLASRAQRRMIGTQGSFVCHDTRRSPEVARAPALE